ncbi:uncharacterized protein LOC133784851 [Humulus lupulus]|uniref:uncharacterized protein LOC133784851 n=1 Tax=Humulus lupulus TaxID=3486 RepID=UPI002B410527|nr:uncharacterized protein LOC133784851 [Humulus lupulus]
MSWNVRGLNEVNKHSPVSDLCKTYRIGVGGLLETKLKGSKISRFVDLQFPNWDYYTSPEIEGRLLIVWRKSFVKVTILEESNQYIHCLVKLTGVQQSFGVTFIYGKDRSGGKPISGLELGDPIRWLADSYLEPLKSVGSYFTWTNNQHGAARIYTKIDHVPEKLGIRVFRFYNYWTDHQDFHAQVLRSWKLPINAIGIRAIYLKLLRLKHCLKAFNTDKIGDLKANFYKAKETFQKRKSKNGIVSFITEDGKMVDKFSEVVSHFVGHFRDFLGSSSSTSGRINDQIVELGPQLSVEQQMKLLKPFSRKEIRESLFSIPITKSPGPDGFGSGLFEAVWYDIRDEVCAAITHCFEYGIFPTELHETTLSLIPKVANPSRVVDYRPIVCCSTLYKCMSKLICKRLADILPDLIQPNQGAFVKGHSIVHNIMIFQDLIKNYGRASTSSRCTIKIDLRKVYDTVDWDFLENMLKALKFPMKFIGWVMACVRNTSYFLLMNGRIQGSLAAVRVVKEVLDSFASATGLSINSGKSHVFFGGVSNTDRTRIAHELNLTEGLFPLNYLGVPMRPTKWKHEDCEVILQKFCLKIQNWASRHLSLAGRIQLINSVLLGLRNYWMSIFVFPQSIVKEIEKICRGFLRGSAGQRSKLHVPSWQKVCLPKAYGGLGFREGATWNRVVWYWRKLCHLKDHFRPADITSAGVQGRFKTTTLYNSLLIQQRDEYYRTIWRRIILPNHRFMLWQVVNSHLLTRDNLSRMKIQITSELCPVCDRIQESHSHLFFECNFSTQLVKCVFDWLGFVAWPLDFHCWLVWLARARKGVKADIVNLVCAAVTYSTWKNRNKCFHEGYSSTVLKLTQDIKYTTKYRLNIVSKSHISVKDQLYIRQLQCSL